MGRRRKRRRKPSFGGFDQLRDHPVLVGMRRDLTPRPEESTGGIVVHELESVEQPPEGAAREPARPEPLDLFELAHDVLDENPSTEGVTSFGGMRSVTAQGGPGGTLVVTTSGGGSGGRRHGGGGRHHPIDWRYWSWMPYSTAYGCWGTGWCPGMPRPADCQRPLSPDCEAFRVTRQWAVVCFVPTYNRMRTLYGPELEPVAQAILEYEAPGCGSASSSAARELRYRVLLATAILLRAEGNDVDLPVPPGGPRPTQPSSDQPWLHALLTGRI